MKERIQIMSINALFASFTDKTRQNIQKGLVICRLHALLTVTTQLQAIQKCIDDNTAWSYILSNDNRVGFFGLTRDFFLGINNDTLMFVQSYIINFEGMSFTLLQILHYFYVQENSGNKTVRNLIHDFWGRSPTILGAFKLWYIFTYTGVVCRMTMCWILLLNSFSFHD